jgi:DNA-3-methyladenine glycosylase I
MLWRVPQKDHSERSMTGKKLRRCGWGESDPMYLRYHDEEWGVPVHNDRRLFEMLTLEGMQAGLSWLIVLRKREEYRKAFDNFDVSRIARYTEKKVQELLLNPGIIRNRLKITAAIDNAKAFLKVQKEFGSFDKFLWSFVGGKPRQNRFKRLKEIPNRTPESEAMSRELKKRGFRFVGSTICYAFMQAVGMVNDHLVSCYRHEEIAVAIKKAVK